MQELDYFQSDRMLQLQEQIKATESENERKVFLSALAREIVNAINGIAGQKFDDGATINNFDEVQAALRNELNRVTKPLTKLLQGLNLSTEAQSKLLMDIEVKASQDFRNEFQPIIVKRQKQLVHIDNLDEIPVINELSVTNLGELEAYFTTLGEVIRTALKIDIAAPVVHVAPAQVNIPETRIPEVSFDNLIGTLEKLLKPLYKNSKTIPLAVRMTNGQEWVKELKEIANTGKQTVQYMSETSRLRDSKGNFINPATADGQQAPATLGDGTATVTVAGTRVQLSLTPVACSRVIIVGNSANVGKVYVGGVTIATGRGRPLNQEQNETLRIRNLNQVYIDSDNSGDGVSFVYEA